MRIKDSRRKNGIGLKKIVYGAMVKRKVRRRKKEIGHKDWDRNCTKKER